MNGHPDEPTDDRLIQSTLAGDEAAFAELVRRHRHRVFARAARFTRGDAELDDLCQEIFVKTYQKLGSFRGEAPFEHWLARLAVRTCYDFLRQRRRQPVTVPLDQVTVAAADNDSREQARELLAAALAQLPAEQRLVITLLELEEKSVREVAELTGWSEANVKVRAFRARQALKRLLENKR